MADAENARESGNVWHWVIVILTSAVVIGWGLLNFLAVPDVPRTWHYGALPATPAQSIYSTAPAPPAVGAPRQLPMPPEARPKKPPAKEGG
jgi:hypothetical protein